MKVMELERRCLGKYSPVSTTPDGSAPPSPMPVKSRNMNSSTGLPAMVVIHASKPNATMQPMATRLWPK